MYSFFLLPSIPTADALNHAGQFQRCVDDLRHNLVCSFLKIVPCIGSFGYSFVCFFVRIQKYSELNTKCYLPIREFVKEDIQAAKVCVWSFFVHFDSPCYFVRAGADSNGSLCHLHNLESEEAVRCSKEQIRISAKSSQIAQGSKEHSTNKASNGE